MPYSVLISDTGQKGHMLYCSETQSAILHGTKAEMYDWKNVIEKMERDSDNKEWAKNLKKERLEMLMNSGNSFEDSEIFLRLHMPFLFTKQTA